MKTSAAEIMTAYALFLMIIGAMSYLAAGQAPNAMSSVYVANGCALVCFILAVGMRDINLRKGQSGYRIMMVCVHLALFVPLLMAVAMSWRLSLAWNVPQKQYVLPYFAAIIALSLLTFIGLYSFKPNKEETRDNTVASDDASQITHVTDDDPTINDDRTSVIGAVDRTAVANTMNGSRDTPTNISEGLPSSGAVPNARPPKAHTGVVRKRARRAVAM